MRMTAGDGVCGGVCGSVACCSGVCGAGACGEGACGGVCWADNRSVRTQDKESNARTMRRVFVMSRTKILRDQFARQCKRRVLILLGRCHDRKQRLGNVNWLVRVRLLELQTLYRVRTRVRDSSSLPRSHELTKVLGLRELMPAPDCFSISRKPRREPIPGWPMVTSAW